MKMKFNVGSGSINIDGIVEQAKAKRRCDGTGILLSALQIMKIYKLIPIYIKEVLLTLIVLNRLLVF